MEANDSKMKRFQEHMDNKIKELHDFIHLNEFNNSENKKLERQVRFLKKDIDDYRDEIKELNRKNKNLNNNIDYLENELTAIRNKKRKRPTSELEVVDDNPNWLSNYKRKRPRKYNYLNTEIRNKQLIDIFKNINTIEDIINLEKLEKNYDYLKNKKFENIFRLIPSLKKLNNLIGMKKVKEQVMMMIFYFIHDLNNPEELNHIVITGPPGVGKTTLAKILGNIYKNLGFLKNNKFLKARRSDLIGQFCGQTAIKTQKVIDDAEGGVLFIDEVYSLGNPNKKDVFTKECIDTINLNLTEKADKLLVIIAGYHDDVNTCFFNYNQGLERRFPLRFEIEKYNSEELFEILNLFVNSEAFKIDENDKDNIKKLLNKNYDCFKFMGGDMMTLFKYTKEHFSINLMKYTLDNKNFVKIFYLKDFEYAVNKFKESKKNNKDEMPEWVKNLYT